MNLKFRRQHVIAPYIVDFYCHELGLVIELDGSQHGTDDGIEYDAERTKFLEALDLKCGIGIMMCWSDGCGLEDLWRRCSELKNTSP
jgi:adenine-specific DNA-methyltransferase